MGLETCDHFEEGWYDDIVDNQGYRNDQGYGKIGKIFFL